MNFLHHNVSCNNSISDEVVLDTDMLDLRMLGIIFVEMNSTLTIRKYSSDIL